MTTANRLDNALSVDAHLKSVFPRDFLWGTASSAYQVEGATREDGRSPSIWDKFAATPGKTYQGETGEVATDHYHKMEEDVALMAQLGIGAYRFSVAWPRVIPEGTGQINPRGLDFYDRLVDTLLAAGIQPAVTLYHWDLPLALHERGGWLNRDTVHAFADYAEVVARHLGDRAHTWITFNEPWCVAYLGYGSGEHAPGLHDKQAAVTVAHNLLLAHGLAVPRLRAADAAARVGITLDFSPAYAADARPETARAVAWLDAFKNRWFADPIFRGHYPDELFAGMSVQPPDFHAGDMEVIAAPLDFLGVNYYSRSLIRGRSGADGQAAVEFVSPVPGALYTEMGWEVFPQGLTDLLVHLHREYAPPALVVTENGAAFVDDWNGDGAVPDAQRQAYLAQHLEAMARAIQQGVPLAGYFLWSLTDNFEWALGYSKRFGIVYVDYPTQRRIVKDSGLWYAGFLRSLKE
ncbi:MAG TPA: GH1 family beta-glucosidase [Ktedonobacterales bacterium]|nr:GH1 family beta-glucosidase [Ktedonobacterales bacterium]